MMALASNATKKGILLDCTEKAVREIEVEEAPKDESQEIEDDPVSYISVLRKRRDGDHAFF